MDIKTVVYYLQFNVAEPNHDLAKEEDIHWYMLYASMIVYFVQGSISILFNFFLTVWVTTVMKKKQAFHWLVPLLLFISGCFYIIGAL